MFTLILTDRNGTPLNEGDIVRISNAERFTFYAEVKYLEKEKAIAPFHTFSFHSFEKVDSVPDKAKLSTEERYKIWYVYDESADADDNAKAHEGYLIDWRTCEHLIDGGKKCFHIEKH